MNNHRIVVTRRGGPEVLQVTEFDLPEPAAGVSAYDAMLRSRWFPGFPRTPFVPGADIVGVVDKLGDGVTTLTEGQTVTGGPLRDNGGYAEFLCLPANASVPVPDGVDPVAAVCLVVNYITAHIALHRSARVESGERVLIHGAAGGVGTALLELGRLAGLEMYATASAPNHELVTLLGAIPIDYRSDDFVSRIHELTGSGVNAVFDSIGGARQVWRSARALRKGGRLAWFGVAATSRAGLRVIPLTLLSILLLKLTPNGKQIRLQPDADTPAQTQILTELLELLAAGKLNPIVAERMPLHEAARAHELLQRGGYAGKIVLVTDT